MDFKWLAQALDLYNCLRWLMFQQPRPKENIHIKAISIGDEVKILVDGLEAHICGFRIDEQKDNRCRMKVHNCWIIWEEEKQE